MTKNYSDYETLQNFTLFIYYMNIQNVSSSRLYNGLQSVYGP